jgi:hypothetical protein
LNINITEEILLDFLNNQDNKNSIIDEMKKLRIREKIKIILQIPYMVDNKTNYEENLYMDYDPKTNSNFPNNKRNRPLIQAPPNQNKPMNRYKNTSNNNSILSNMNNTDYRKRYSKLMMMIHSKEFTAIFKKSIVFSNKNIAFFKYICKNIKASTLPLIIYN